MKLIPGIEWNDNDDDPGDSKVFTVLLWKTLFDLNKKSAKVAVCV